MALNFLNYGDRRFEQGGLLAGNPLVTPDFNVDVTPPVVDETFTVSYDVTERNAGAFTLFAVGNFLAAPNNIGGGSLLNNFDFGLVDNSELILNGNITLGLVALGWGRDALMVEGSAALSLISMDAGYDPRETADGSLYGLTQGAAVDAANYTTMVGGFVASPTLSPLQPEGYNDFVAINGNLTLSILGTGLGSDTVELAGGLQGALVLLDGLEGSAPAGAPSSVQASRRAQKNDDTLVVNNTSNLATVLCGSGKDKAVFKASLTLVDVYGGEGNDNITLEKGVLGLNSPDNYFVWSGAGPQEPLSAGGLLGLLPSGVISGGSGKDKITFAGGSSSLGALILGGDACDGFESGDDIINFNAGSASNATALRGSVIGLGDGSDRINFGAFSYLREVLIDCGAGAPPAPGLEGTPSFVSDNAVDTLDFGSRRIFNSSSFNDPSAPNSTLGTTIVNFGDEDKAIIRGITYTGADARTALFDAGFNVIWTI